MTNFKALFKLIAALTVMAVLATGCGGDGSENAITDPSSSTTAGRTESVSGGWIDGEPDWNNAKVYMTDGDAMATEYESDGAAMAEDSAALGPADRSESTAPGSPPVDDLPNPSDNPLRAGSVDDNADYSGFLAYLERLAGIGIALRDLDPTNRSIVTVTTPSGAPAPGVAIEVSAGNQTAEVRTTADGTIRFHPAFYGMDVGELSYAVVGSNADPVVAAVGSDVSLTADVAALATPVPLDVLFLLDATGSMGDEIDRLKTTIDTVAQQVSALDPAPDVRFAMTLYRDEGDLFVTANYDFTSDIAEFQSALADVVADGGGDYPEALDEGLADALAKPSWRDPSEAVQLIFVVADAPPQVTRQVATPYTDSIRTAITRGIKIFPVASSESDDQAEAVFRQMAQATGAPFVFLSNGAAGAATGANTDITTTDYEELSLDALVVRLIAEELSDLSGGSQVVVPTTSVPVTTTTNPDGQ